MDCLFYSTFISLFTITLLFKTQTQLMTIEGLPQPMCNCAFLVFRKIKVSFQTDTQSAMHSNHLPLPLALANKAISDFTNQWLA